MKFSNLVIMITMLFSSFAWSQLNLGIKAGLNYDTLGDITSTEELSLNMLNSNSETGFHMGIYTNLDLLVFYLRPELQYTQTKSKFGEQGSLSLNKLEAPVLLGYKLLGPLSVFAGPSFQYIISDQSDEITLGELKENFTVSLQMGTELKLGRLGVGIRFERGFTDNEVIILNQNDINFEAGQIDTRSKQWILSLSYDLNPKVPTRVY